MSRSFLESTKLPDSPFTTVSDEPSSLGRPEYIQGSPSDPKLKFSWSVHCFTPVKLHPLYPSSLCNLQDISHFPLTAPRVQDHLIAVQFHVRPEGVHGFGPQETCGLGIAVWCTTTKTDRCVYSYGFYFVSTLHKLVNCINHCYSQVSPAGSHRLPCPATSC